MTIAPVAGAVARVDGEPIALDQPGKAEGAVVLELPTIGVAFPHAEIAVHTDSVVVSVAPVMDENIEGSFKWEVEIMTQIGRIVGPLAAVLATVGTAAPTAAQASAEETVPLEFVEVLSGSPFGPAGTPEALVGGIPQSTARVLPLPDDGRIVGSLVYRAYAVSAVAVPGVVGTVRDDWTDRLLGAGWTRYQPPSRGGFESRPAEGLQFCMGDSVTLNLGVTENPRGGSYVTVMHPTGRQYSICRHRERPHMPMNESLIPSLAPPGGAVALGSGSGGGGDHWDAHARIQTNLTVDELVDHYGSQLRTEGWEVLERTSGQETAVEGYRMTDPEGAAWHGVLVASAPAGERDRFLSLRLTRVERIR